MVLFIADGLRFSMVDDHIAPTMAAIARNGVSLRNGHALFPTFTMANASGPATCLVTQGRFPTRFIRDSRCRAPAAA
jgi:predicted AlkP superfamily pyrophosphatase or phosphodiesterase